MNEAVRESLVKALDGLDISQLSEEQKEELKEKFEALLKSHKDDIAYIETVLERLS